ncbi:MAG: VanZ family protein [Alphaproteobacteria bacterium]|nr:VanZ family protein [Alphaproteobacteria bacterium]
MTLALALVIGFLTLTPISDAGVPGSDKIHHFLAFFALTLPLAFARPRLALWIVLAAMAYGGAIELIQPFVGRSKDIFDFLADGVGSISAAAVGMGLAWLRYRVA